MEKKLWNVYEERDEDGGFGDAIYTRIHVGTVLATDQEIEEFLKVWDKPRIYDHPYDDLYEHHVVAESISLMDIESLQPYDPKTRDWPDIPHDVPESYQWDGEKWTCSQ